MTSAIYNGTVIHKRFKPKLHFFKYKVFSLLIDLSELDILSKNISFFSHNRFNLISFFDKDHGARDGTSLVEWVKKNLNENKIDHKGQTEYLNGCRRGLFRWILPHRYPTRNTRMHPTLTNAKNKKRL